jgi:hypothetical protein
MNSTGRCSCTANLLRWTKTPGLVSKKRSISSSVLKWLAQFEGRHAGGSIPIGRLGVEEVCDRNEAGTYHSPNDPKLPADVLDARQCNLHNNVVHDPVRRHG